MLFVSKFSSSIAMPNTALPKPMLYLSVFREKEIKIINSNDDTYYIAIFVDTNIRISNKQTIV